MPDDEPDLTADELAALEREHDELRARLHELAEHYLAIHRRMPSGPSSEERVAYRLGISRRQVRRHLNRALTKLRKHLLQTTNSNPPQP